MTSSGLYPAQSPGHTSWQAWQLRLPMPIAPGQTAQIAGVARVPLKRLAAGPRLPAAMLSCMTRAAAALPAAPNSSFSATACRHAHVFTTDATESHPMHPQTVTPQPSGSHALRRSANAPLFTRTHGHMDILHGHPHGQDMPCLPPTSTSQPQCGFVRAGAAQAAPH